MLRALSRADSTGLYACVFLAFVFAIPAIGTAQKIEIQVEGQPKVQIQVQIQVQAAKPKKQKPANGKPVQKAEDKKGEDKKTDDKPADKNAQPAAPKKMPAFPNGFGNFLKKLFLGPAANRLPGAVPKPQANKPANGDDKARDHIDGLAPHDPKQSSLLRRAKKLMDEDNWKLSMEILQYVLERPNDSLVRQPNGRWLSSRTLAVRLLGAFPAEALEQYRNLYQALAERLLEDAKKTGDLGLYSEIAGKFFHTPAGQQAANHLGTVHFDRGEFGMATLWFQRLLKYQSPITKDAQWQVKAALALRETGQVKKSSALLEQLKANPAGQTLKLGGAPDTDLDRWLAALGSLSIDSIPLLKEWPLFNGTASRKALSEGSRPALLSRWFQPVTESHSITKQLELLIQDISDMGKSPMPAFFPLMVNGNIVFRTLGGVRVVDAKTGKTRWETLPRISAEQLINGSPQSSTSVQQIQQGVQIRVVAKNFIVGNRGISYRLSSGNADRHPLANLMFRNSTFGIVSSAGGQLFVIEDQPVLSQRQPGYNFSRGRNQGDPLYRDWSSNTLVSYDLKSGRPLWEIGGTASGEPFNLPLAGQCFLGAPVADRGELFILGEKDNEIHLFALDALTGKLKWDQLISYSDAKIERDLVRRWWSLQVSVGNGVIVCPTGIGWLVAVNRANHSVLWAHRYTTPGQKQHNTQTAEVQLRPLNNRWGPAAPVIIDDKVLFTPPEAQALVCLSLMDGTSLWSAEKTKGTLLYFGGVFDKSGLLIGRDSISAISLNNGATKWSLTIPNESGQPSGVGVATETAYHLPLQSGELWSINLKTGKLISKSYLPKNSHPLGNLALYRGMFLSLSPFGVESFEQRESIQQEIQLRLAKNDGDPWALIKQAQLQILKRDFPAALKSLHAVPTKNLSDELQPQFRAALVHSLTELVQSDFSSFDSENSELENASQSPAEQFHYEILQINRLIARKSNEAAFDRLWNFNQVQSSQLLSRLDDSRTLVELGQWIAGRFSDIYQQSPQNLQQNFDNRIQVEAEQVLTQNLESQQKFLNRFWFHPESQNVAYRVVKTYQDNGDFLLAENLLKKLSRTGNQANAAKAYLKLAELYKNAKLNRSFELTLKHVETLFNEVTLSDGRKATDLAAKLRKAPHQDQSTNNRTQWWTDFDLKVTRGGGSYYSSNQIQNLALGGSTTPFFTRFRYQFNTQRHRLDLTSSWDDSMFWTIPLRSRLRSSGSALNTSVTDHQLVLLHNDVLHCLSPVERKSLWSKPLDSRSSSVRRQNYRTASYSPMQTSVSAISQWGLVRRGQKRGKLVVSNGEYICTFGRREVIVYDAMTGLVRFKRQDILPQTAVFGNEHILFLVPTDHTQAIALRAQDGKPIAIKNIAELFANSVHFAERGLVRLTTTNSSADSAESKPTKQLVVDQFDPLTTTTQWKVNFPAESYLTFLDENSMIVLLPDGQLLALDLNSGQVKKMGNVAPKDIKDSKSSMYVISDHRQIYLIANIARRGMIYSSYMNFRSQPVHGKILAFDKTSGQPLWKRDLKDLNLVLSQFNESPILTLYARKYKKKNKRSYWETSITAVDKRTGRILAETNSPSNSGFNQIKLNLAERYLELRSYNQRLRLTAVPRSAKPAK